METPDFSSRARALPQVDRLIEALGPADSEPHPLRAEAARAAIAEARAAVRDGAPAPSLEALVAAVNGRLAAGRRRRLVPVVNATGVLLHTNLGRAPMGAGMLAAIEEVAMGYSNLEFDLAAGRRGSRYDHARALITALTGAEAALVVNNNAAAVLLVLAAVARGREVIISRGELIEIGGEFRIPEILTQSGAVLREVGTTNRTHPKDYRGALGEATGAILKVHPSNYEVVGFVKSVPGAELADIAHGAGVPLIHDIGSGLLHRRIAGRTPGWLAAEPCVEEALADGADVVTFSGDKLLGGPQAGIIVGRAALVAAMEKSPLLRTYRVDKTTLAALEATLLAYLQGRECDIPLWAMALQEPAAIRARAEAVRSSVAGLAGASLVDGFSTTGGGSAPGCRIPTVLLEVTSGRRGAGELRAALVAGDPPVIARVEEDRLVLDLRTVAPEQDAVVSAALNRVLA
ncbi:MAG TPA: L-seryl-tRNA(Sec) selenium transferase [Actinomycetota bacterium]|nr:L-seryl-tRNA(Sec) selenium transferase [Actinomycetota bacterium]